MSQSHWIDPERIFDSVVVLTDDALYVCNPPEERAREIAAALEAGEPASMVMKEDPTTILVGGITKVRYDRKDDDVTIHYRAGKESDDKNISFSSAEERDAFMIELAERLPECDSDTVEWGPVRAALGPLAFGGFAGFMTWVLHAAAVAMAAGAEAEASGRRAGLKKLVMGAVELIGPIGVLVVGGLVLALTGAFLVMRVKNPPIWTTLTPKR